MLDRAAPRLCQEHVDALVTDGANAICDRFAGPPSIALALGLTLAAAFAWRAGGRWRGRLLGATIVLSLPGMVALGARRADAPRHAWSTAARLEASQQAIEEEASATACAPQTFACAACEPIARYARARVASCQAASAAAVTSRGELACEEATGNLLCGGR